MSRNNKHRQSILKNIHRLYRRCDARLEGKCVYCGKFADTEDHIPPVSLAINIHRENLSAMDPVLVPACRHCNSVIGASEQIKLVDRRDIVATHLSTKKKRMLDRGQKLISQKLSFSHDFRDLACINIFERWQFASITQHEVEEPDPPEEIYEREDFTQEMDLADLTPYQILSSWGLSDSIVDRIGSMEIEQQKRAIKKSTDLDIAIFTLYECLQPMRGPFNWLGTWAEFSDTLCKRFGEQIDHELVSLKFAKVKTSQEAFFALNRVLMDAQILKRENAILSFNGFHSEYVPATNFRSRSHDDHTSKLVSLKEFISRHLEGENEASTISVPKEIWFFERSQSEINYYFEFYRAQIDLIVSEYRYVSKEIKNLNCFEKYLKDLPASLLDEFLTECNTVEIYVLLLTHIKMFRGSFQRDFLQIKI